MTSRALGRPACLGAIPRRLLELQGYLSDTSLVPTIQAIPVGHQGAAYILGSSLFGAQLAAALGLPYAFASHFAPDALQQAVEVYRRDFRPSVQLTEPYAIAAVNVVVTDEQEHAEALAASVLRSRVRSLASRVPAYAGQLDDAAVDALMDSPVAAQARHMMTYSAVGDIATVRDYLDRFAEHANADEVMVTNAAPGLDDRLRALELLASP